MITFFSFQKTCLSAISFLGFMMLVGYCHAQSHNAKIGGDSLSIKIEKLKQLYNIISGAITVDDFYQREFLSEFPNSFKEFVDIYGYTDKKPSPLYWEAESHILKTFNVLSDTSDTTYYEKIINISIGGSWDADAVSYFQNGLRSRIVRNLNLSLFLLNKFNDDNIKKFFMFYFDGPAPNKVIPIELQSIKEMSPKMYDLMSDAHLKVLKKWEER